MTRDEAILILEEEAEFLYGTPLPGNAPYNKTAFDMAIEALLADRPQGEWVKTEGDSRYMCSVCKVHQDYVPTCMGEPTIWDYCPSCGARMKGGAE